MSAAFGDRQRAAEYAVVEVPLVRLRVSEENPRRIGPEKLEQLKRSLAADPAMLQARPLIALPDGTVIAGNMRLRAAQELGWHTIPVVYADLDHERARLWMLRDNQAYGAWDDDALAELLAELGREGSDLDLTGFAEDELARILDGIAEEPAPAADDLPPLPDEPESKPEETYELGPHRLLCGDATDADAVRELMRGQRAALMATDPPYGVGVDHSWRDGLRQPIGAARTGLVANDDRADWREAYALTDAAVAYVWHSALHSLEVWQGLVACGFEIRQQIVWVKSVHVLGRAAYQWRHEPCWYAVRTSRASSRSSHPRTCDRRRRTSSTPRSSHHAGVGSRRLAQGGP